MCSPTDLSCMGGKKMPLLAYVKSIWIQSRKSKLERPSETIWSTLLHLLVRKLGPRDGEQLAQGQSASTWTSGTRTGVLRLPSSVPFPTPEHPEHTPGPSKPGQNEDPELWGWLGSTPGNVSNTNQLSSNICWVPSACQMLGMPR